MICNPYNFVLQHVDKFALCISQPEASTVKQTARQPVDLAVMLPAMLPVN
jgi:hypothetical protein